MKKIHAAIYMFWAIGLFFAIGIIFWFIPRDVIDIEIRTDKEEYRLGETILTDNRFVSYGSAESDYVSRIVCRNGVERRTLLFAISSQTEKREPSVSKAQYAIPNYIEPGHNCVIQITSQHTVQVLPFLQKTIFDSFESNEFRITE